MRIRMNLRVARINLGMKQADLAEKIGKTQEYISRLETCQIEPKRKDAKALAEILGQPEDFLFDQNIKEQPGGTHSEATA